MSISEVRSRQLISTHSNDANDLSGVWRIPYEPNIPFRHFILTPAGCGKTQLCHTMCVIAQLPKVLPSHRSIWTFLTSVGHGWC